MKVALYSHSKKVRNNIYGVEVRAAKPVFGVVQHHTELRTTLGMRPMRSLKRLFWIDIPHFGWEAIL